ncbi:MAG: CDP-alcohol phosphatidyltransferase family protein [Chitinispirillaceae bacterium]|jgi:CDP-diacylglycerol--glycerol-3-phosphate 3-phosphatidyltransferase
MALTLANKITFIRLFCIPFFVLLLLYYDWGVRHGEINDLLRIAASILFIGTFLSDALDGYIARTRNQISHLGTIIDPLADKALLLSALILLSRASPSSYQVHLPIWFVWLVISRDCMLVTGAILIHVTVGAVAVKPRIAGKLTTFFQTILIVWILTNLHARHFAWMLGTAALLTVISGTQYFIDGVRQFDKFEKEGGKRR